MDAKISDTQYNLQINPEFFFQKTLSDFIATLFNQHPRLNAGAKINVLQHQQNKQGEIFINISP